MPSVTGHQMRPKLLQVNVTCHEVICASGVTRRTVSLRVTGDCHVLGEVLWIIIVLRFVGMLNLKTFTDGVI